MVVDMKKVRGADEDDEYFVKDILEVYREQQVITKYRVYIDELITDPSRYRGVMNILGSANENDVVVFHINSSGGNLYSAIQLYNAILNTEARTVAIAEGIVASAATLPLLACDDVIVMHNSFVMVHAASWGIGGDMKLIRDGVKFHTDHLETLIRSVYDGFMSEDEITDMIENSKEYYMKTEEVIERLKTRQEIVQKGVDKALAEVFESDGDNTDVPVPTPKKAVKKAPAKKTPKKQVTK